jgi:hypothetical protein
MSPSGGMHVLLSANFHGEDVSLLAWCHEIPTHQRSTMSAAMPTTTNFGLARGLPRSPWSGMLFPGLQGMVPEVVSNICAHPKRERMAVAANHE